MTEPKKLDARGVLKLLEAHYNPPNRQPSWNLLSEIQAPSSNRRADLIAMGLGSSSGYQLVGHEIKVTRADLVHELEDLTKPDPWLRYCQQWWLVVADPALVEDLEIPERWGVMAPPSGRRTRSMTMLRDAPKVKVDDLGPAYRTIAAKSFWGTRERERAYRWAREDAARMRQENDDLRRTLHTRKYEAQALKPEEKWAIELIKAVMRRNNEHNVYGLSHFPDQTEAAEAISDLSVTRIKIQRHEHQLTMLLDTLKRQHATLGNYIDHVKEPTAE